MSRTAHEIALQAWLERVAVPAGATRVIYADQRAPRPELPYVTLMILSDAPATWASRIERQYELEGDDTLTQHSWLHREGTISVQAYGPGHDAIVEAIELSLDDDAEGALLDAAGVVLPGVLMPRRRVGQFSSNVVEDRSAVDISYRRVASREIADVDVIESVTTTATLEGAPEGDITSATTTTAP